MGPIITKLRRTKHQLCHGPTLKLLVDERHMLQTLLETNGSPPFDNQTILFKAAERMKELSWFYSRPIQALALVEVNSSSRAERIGSQLLTIRRLRILFKNDVDFERLSISIRMPITGTTSSGTGNLPLNNRRTIFTAGHLRASTGLDRVHDRGQYWMFLARSCCV